MTTEKSTQSVPEEQVSKIAEDVTVVANVANELVEEPVQESKAEDAEKPCAETFIDFSDEEAHLAANSSDFNLGEEIADEQTNDEVKDSSVETISSKTKDELIEMFGQLLESKPVQSIRKDVEVIKISFYKIHRTELDLAKKTFVDAGGNIEDFDIQIDNSEQKFKELFMQYRKKRDEFVNIIEQQKESNLVIKLKIIEDLKELINSGERLDQTFTAFRELQQRWKDVGLVPQTKAKDLWETYNLYVEKFYDFIKINKELRDLDLKRNYEAKLILCEETEALVIEPSIVSAFYKLQKLHEQWREIGPVTNEYKELLWSRFKEASSRINKQHQEYFEGLKEEQKRNLDIKNELCINTEALVNGAFSSRKDWNKASEKLIEIQKIWKTIGFAPKKDNSTIYERFRNACDNFFEQKRNFYLHIKTEMEHNFELKNEICQIAESLKESQEWKKSTEELILLQKRWKDIGPVSRRHSDAMWKRFRSACDEFFKNKSTHFSTVDEQYQLNLVAKLAILEEIETCDMSAVNFNTIKELQRRWSEIGFVPIKEKEKIQNKYKSAMDKLFTTLRGSDKERQMDKFKSKIHNIKGKGGEKKINYERDRLYNKIKQLETDIALLENNIGFFSKSKNAESMIKDVRNKIDRAKQEMKATIEMVQMIDNQDKEKE